MPRRQSRNTPCEKFADFIDPHNPYMYHCHILEHEDAGMMDSSWWFEPDAEVARCKPRALGSFFQWTEPSRRKE